MLRKFLKVVFGLSLAAGLIMVVGTAGASDLNTIDDITLIKQVFTGIALMAAGGVGLRIIDPNCFN